MRFILIIFLIFFYSLAVARNVESTPNDVLNEFLVAKPHMLDPRFQETVIYLLYHDQNGAAGLVINKPIKTISISNLFTSSNLTPPENVGKKEITLYWGGPVQPQNIFFIHSSDYKSKDYILLNKNFTISQDADILFDIVNNKGPRDFLILTGIAVWSPGQLDFEMNKGDWYKKSNSYILLFNNENEIWDRLINSQDI